MDRPKVDNQTLVEFDYPRTTAEIEDLRRRNVDIEAIRIQQMMREGEDRIATSRIASLTASRDAATVQRTISERYGFTPTLEYCAALVDFVEALTDGQ